MTASYEAVKYFRHMLEARRFTVLTDHKPLTFAFHKKRDKCSPRQFNHLDFISQFESRLCSRAVQACSSIAPLYTVATLEYKTLPVHSVRKSSSVALSNRSLRFVYVYDYDTLSVTQCGRIFFFSSVFLLFIYS